MNLYLKKNCIEAGCDEAGRGCLAGPVVAAAVILPPDFYHAELNDSKKMTDKQRDKLKDIIKEEAIAYAIAQVDNIEIDKINILWASVKAMHLAVEKLNTVPEHLLIDGNRFKPYKKIPYTCVVSGDSLYTPIAAASVLAKTYRDAYMQKLHNDFPHYDWNKNKGYPTKKHREAIQEHGITSYHRRSFKTSDTQLKLDL